MLLRRTPWLTLSALLACLTWFALVPGCGINPVPEPPSVQRVDPPDVTHVTLAPDPMMVSNDVDVQGAPGAAEPNAQVWVVNLDGTAPPSLATVQADGSFALTISGFAGDELRLQARKDDLRSDPVDVLVPAAPGPAVPSVRALADCLLLDPPLELLLPPPSSAEPPFASIVIENQCGADVVLDDLRLRTPTSSFAVAPVASPIPQGGSAEIVVRAYGSAGEEAILFVSATTPQKDRRPISLVSRGGSAGLQPACEATGGACLSDPIDPSFPADCSALGQLTLQASCVSFNHACCIEVP